MARQDKGLTRRQMLAGTGAAIASAGVVSLGSADQGESINWDHETDILVVGSGVGASTAAITAHENGDAVILIEKAGFAGGTSSKSAGVLWIPNNFSLRKKGIEDTKDDCVRYQARFSYPERFNPDDQMLGLSRHELSLLEAFYDNASAAVDSLRHSQSLNVAEWRMFFLDRPATDYLDHVSENKVPAGRALGPIQADGSMGLGVELMAQLGAALEKRKLPILLNHRAAGLLQDADGRVIGVGALSEGKNVNLKARKAVIFATGGYAHNQEMLNNFQPARLYGSCAMPAAEGDFINIAAAAGARMGNIGGAWRTQILLEDALQSRYLNTGVFFPPGDSAIQVNKYGLRAVDENRNYNDRTEIHGMYDASNAEYPNQLMFMIYDQRTAQAFAGDYPLPADNAEARHVLSGATLAELSNKIGARLEEIKAHTGGLSLASDFTTNLQSSINRFNQFAKSGVDRDFQRGKHAYDSEWFQVFSPMKSDSGWPVNENPSVTMHPLSDQGPFYAIILAAGALDTCGGPVIDAGARVLDTKNAPIAGLYGAGNCIASPSADAYYGAGHTLGMSMTFGYIAANSAHKES
jgi:succinate dehydrogenase/fumarate reductase flavoprotein subunit